MLPRSATASFRLVLLSLLLLLLAPSVQAASLAASVFIDDPNGTSSLVEETDALLVNPSLVIPPGTGARGRSFAEAYGDESGRVRAFARTGSEAHEASSSVQWSETIERVSGPTSYDFTVTPGFLEILHGLPTGGEQLIQTPYAEMSIQIATSVGLVWEHTARIEGRGGDVITETFELVRDQGGLKPLSTYSERTFPNPFGPDTVDSARYETPRFNGTFDLSQVTAGDQVDISYILLVAVGGDGLETSAAAFIGDPLDPNTGITTSYSGFVPVPEPALHLMLLGASAAIVPLRRSRSRQGSGCR